MVEIIAKKPKVAAIIVNWNSKSDVLECLESLEQATYPNLEVIVVDNGSNDGSVVAVREQFPRVFVIENGVNLGFGMACNIGISRAMRNGAEYFFLLNSDLKIDRCAVSELLTLCQQYPQVGIAGPIMFDYYHPDKIQQYGGEIELTHAQAGKFDGAFVDSVHLPVIKEVTFIGGGIMFIRRAVIEQVGGYDPVFFLYGEEVDLELRVIQAGYKLMVTSRAQVWHKMYGAFGGKPNARVKYNYFRSWMILGRRYLIGLDYLIFCWSYFVNRLIRFILGCLVRRYFSLIIPAFRGTYDGLRERRVKVPTEKFTTTLSPEPRREAV